MCNGNVLVSLGDIVGTFWPTWHMEQMYLFRGKLLISCKWKKVLIFLSRREKDKDILL